MGFLKKLIKFALLGGILLGILGIILKEKEIEVKLEKEDGWESEEEVEDSSYTRDELEEMSYRDLQSVAKDFGVKANQKKEELVEGILNATS